MTLGSLFDGIGGFPLAATRFGIKPIWASEIEPVPVSITKRHFPEMEHLGDVKSIDGARIKPVDIITFGSPCQDLSNAGLRTGLDGSQSSLFFDAVRIIKQMKEGTNGKYPTRIIWENVTGAFSSNEGKDFRSVLQEIASISEPGISIPEPPHKLNEPITWLKSGAIVGNGWSLAWRVLDAQYWGVPQRRERIFLVADFGGESAGEILFKSDSLSRDTAESEKEGKGITADTEKSIRTTGFDGRCSSIERAPLQGQAKGQYTVDFGRVADRIQMNADKAVTLQAEGGGGGAKTGLYCLPTFCIQGNTIERSDEAGANGKGVNEEVSFTLNTTDRHAVAYQNSIGALCARDYKGVGEQYVNEDKCIIAAFSQQRIDEYKESDVASTIKNRDYKDSTDLIAVNYLVRRLTPLECERLQGFPDGWTEYGINPEKYRASLERGKKRTGLPESVLLQKISDNKRYKALGNSVAVPCIEFLMSRISINIEE